MTTLSNSPNAGWALDGGPDDVISPRDLYRAMCIARAMGEHHFAERLRAALVDAFSVAGALIPDGAESMRPALH